MAVGVRALGSPTASDILATDRRQFYLRPNTFSELYPNVAPFYTFASKLRRITNINDVHYKMFEHRLMAVDKWYTTIASGSNAVAIAAVGSDNNNVAIVDAGFMVDGLIVEIRASDGTLKAVQRVKNVDSQTQVDLTTIFRSGTPSYATGDLVRVIGTAYGEGSSAPQMWYDDLTTIWNSVQLFRTSVYITNVMRRANLRGGDELRRLLDTKAKEHKIAMARAFYFGVRQNGVGAPSGTQITDANGNIVTTTEGIVSAITLRGLSGANYFAVSPASYTWDNFVDDLAQVYQYPNAKAVKYAFVGYNVMAWFSKLASGLIGNTTSGALNFQLANVVPTAFGFSVRRIEHPFGTLNLVLDPLLRGPYAGLMIVVDPEHIGVAVFEPPAFRTNIQDPDELTYKAEYVSHEGLWFDLIESHAVWQFG